MSVSETRTVKPSSAKALIAKCFADKQPLFLWGPPGIGKSDIVAQVGREQDRPVIDIRLLLMDPTDLRGIPFYNPASNKMEWAPPVDLPDDPNSRAIIFLDEMNAAPQSVQGAAYQLVLNRRIGTYLLPPECVIIAAGNRESDKGVVYQQPKALANRFTHLEMRVDFDDWQNWAIKQRTHPDVVGYLTFSKESLFQFDPKTASRAFPTPRSWGFVSRLLDPNLRDEQQTDLVVGCVGDGAGLQFMSYRRHSSALPNPTDILSGRVTRINDHEISVMYALATGLCYELKTSHDREVERFGEPTDSWYAQADLFLKFMMENFEPDLVIMGARAALSNFDLPFEPSRMRVWDRFADRFETMILEA